MYEIYDKFFLFKIQKNYNSFLLKFFQNKNLSLLVI